MERREVAGIKGRFTRRHVAEATLYPAGNLLKSTRILFWRPSDFVGTRNAFIAFWNRSPLASIGIDGLALMACNQRVLQGAIDSLKALCHPSLKPPLAQQQRQNYIM